MSRSVDGSSSNHNIIRRERGKRLGKGRGRRRGMDSNNERVMDSISESGRERSLIIDDGSS